jgi:hypothetical protein
MNTKKSSVLLAGLPAVGKSTYITALWAVEKDGNSGHLLTCDEYPADSSYIDTMRNNWIELKEVRRTSFAEPIEIVLPMKDSKTGERVDLAMPDFKGEVFQRVLENSVSDGIKTWCDKSNAILFMLRLPTSSPDMLQEEVSDTASSRLEMESVVMQVSDIDPAIQSILLLKYLYGRMKDRPIALCFALWDKADCNEEMNVEQWVKENHPCIYNFVVEHFSNYRFYGISAQGAEYEGLDEVGEDELAERTTRKERAYIYTDKKSFDITEPIAFLVSE